VTTESALTTISGDIYQPAVRQSFECVLSDKSINFEAEAGFAIQCLGANDYTMKVAMNNRQSVVDAVVNIAAIGISLNPAKKQAYLVPRKNKICLDISYMGLMDLAMATGSVRWAQAAIVYSGDTFALNGFDKPPTHTFNPFSKDRGDKVGVYVVVKTSDGDYLTHPMAIADVYDIRDRSESWSRKKDGVHAPSGPWLTDEDEMIKKTCVKQACKYWPRVERLDQVADGRVGPVQLRHALQQRLALARDRGLAARDLSDIARAAVAGKVSLLFVEKDRFEPGRFDRATGGIVPDGVNPHGVADPSCVHVRSIPIALPSDSETEGSFVASTITS
jgi:recombination protein RecT